MALSAITNDVFNQSVCLNISYGPNVPKLGFRIDFLAPDPVPGLRVWLPGAAGAPNHLGLRVYGFGFRIRVWLPADINRKGINQMKMISISRN